VFNNNISVLS